MLRVWKITGVELASSALEEVTGVRTLKERLRDLHGYPVCLQQLLQDGHVLLDDAPRLVLRPSPDETAAARELCYAAQDQGFRNRCVLTALGLAADGGHMEMADMLLEVGALRNSEVLWENRLAAPNGAYRRGSRGSHHADMQQYLAEIGADKDLGSSHTPLSLAAEKGNAELARLLLAAGAQPNEDTPMRHARVPLNCACERGHAEVVSLLLEAGADKNAKGGWSNSADVRGYSPPGPSIAKLLLEAGANPNLQDKAGNTALFLASQNGFETNVRLLLEMGADRDLQNKEGQTALFCASHRNRPEIVALLLDARADADLRTSAGHTALLCVARKGNRKLVGLLLAAKADMDVEDSGGTALFHSCDRGHVHVARLLVEARANLDGPGCRGQTALVRASGHGYVETVRLLLAAGANTEVSDRRGLTALLCACHFNLAVVCLLLEFRADTAVTDRRGQTPLMLACARGQRDIANVLLAAEWGEEWMVFLAPRAIGRPGRAPPAAAAAPPAASTRKRGPPRRASASRLRCSMPPNLLPLWAFVKSSLASFSYLAFEEGLTAPVGSQKCCTKSGLT
ncbi:Ankyrin-1 [Symbiodinium microadriaticum]|uniref:Ankyrin-1 n=1 Tax=Symbiodinium microadriaticum TaxID=2951 RepID=A0A1Q9C9I7_SYMMI|nr:Ankyrin-1 [Symbiodinium microadriaticum]